MIWTIITKRLEELEFAVARMSAVLGSDDP